MWYLDSKIDTIENWAFCNQVFTEAQCEQIIKLGESLLPKTATTFGGEQLNVRDSKVSWITPSHDSEWIFRRMTDVVVEVNNRYFKFDLDGFAEGFQFTKYEAPVGKYDLHVDKSYGKGIRKLSVVVQLSDPADYEGGELHIQIGGEPIVIKKQKSFLAAFPSYVLHGVTPVTKGTRYSLVAWLTGPAFK